MFPAALGQALELVAFLFAALYLPVGLFAFVNPLDVPDHVNVISPYAFLAGATVCATALVLVHRQRLAGVAALIAGIVAPWLTIWIASSF